VGLTLAAAPRPSAAAPRLVASFDDDTNDATGPGTYSPPGDTTFTDGDFDLRRLAVLVDGEDVLFEVTFGAPIRRPVITQRTQYSPLALWSGIYLQNVDIYVDADHAAGSGYGACIPGRRVAFTEGRTWEVAVVLTPQPGPAREVIEDAMGPAAGHVIVVDSLQSRGRTVVARVPAAALGGLPRLDWGYSVHVSGAAWERSFSAQDRLGKTLEPNAYTMPVKTVVEAYTFGGAPAGNAHPRVVDVLLPRGADQKAVLGSFDVASGAWARVPFVYAEPVPPPLAAAAAGPGPAPTHLVADVAADVITVSGPVTGLRPMQIGSVLGADGATVARVVIAKVLPDGLVVSAVEGREKIVRGAPVRFEAPAQPPAPSR
jgi:carbohydrate-binding DOMON domain-containing protein